MRVFCKFDMEIPGNLCNSSNLVDLYDVKTPATRIKLCREGERLGAYVGHRLSFGLASDQRVA